MRGRRKASVIPAALAALCATAVLGDSGSHAQSPPAVTSVTCTGLKKIEVVNSDAPYSTASDTYVDIPDASRTFTPAKPGCVLATFSAAASAFLVPMAVQAVLDASSLCAPNNSSANIFEFADGNDSAPVHANSMTYLCPDAQAGKHRIRMQWESGNGHTAYLYGFTMTVAHR